MRYRIVAVGRVRDAALRAASDEYLGRVRRYARDEEHEVKDEARVLGAGMEGHSSFGHRLLMQKWIARLQPKVALFLVGINDVEREDLKAGDRALQAPAPTGFVERLARHSAVAAALVNLRRSERAEKMRLLHGDVRLQRLPPLPLKPELRKNTLLLHAQRFVPPYKRRVAELVVASREAGIEPVLVTQPALYGEGTDDVTGVDLARVTVDNDPEHLLNGSLAWRVLELYNDAVRDCPARGVLLCQLWRTYGTLY